MKLIQSSVEILEQQPGLDGLYKQIEYAGRTCYKSTDRITEASAKEFVDRMIKLGHGAMLEHGTVYLELIGISLDLEHASRYDNRLIKRYHNNKYSKVIEKHKEDFKSNVYITTNLRVLVENGWMDDLKYICEPTEFHEKRITAKFTCDRGVSHEFVRHRVFSFAQESTRYCNYSKDKFNNEITFIIPSWLDEEELIEEFGSLNLEYDKDIDKFQSSEWTDAGNYLQSLAWSEANYFELLNNEWQPQQARSILPNSLKTELIMTGFESDWQGFFELRCSPKAHPDAQKLANELKELMYGKQEE